MQNVICNGARVYNVGLLLSISCEAGGVVAVVVVGGGGEADSKRDGHKTMDKKKRGKNSKDSVTRYRPSSTGSVLITKSSPEVPSIFVESRVTDVQCVDFALQKSCNQNGIFYCSLQTVEKKKE